MIEGKYTLGKGKLNCYHTAEHTESEPSNHDHVMQNSLSLEVIGEEQKIIITPL